MGIVAPRERRRQVERRRHPDVAGLRRSGRRPLQRDEPACDARALLQPGIVGLALNQRNRSATCREPIERPSDAEEKDRAHALAPRDVFLDRAEEGLQPRGRCRSGLLDLGSRPF